MARSLARSKYERGKKECVPSRQRWVRKAAPIVGSLLGWKSFWQKRSTTELFPTADSPVGGVVGQLCITPESP